jgi:ELWxxDGT repeat protein
MKDTTTNKNYLYFVAEDVGNAYNLWRSDGTPEGTTTLVKDTNTIGSSWLEYLTVMKDIYSNRNYLYFIENNDAGYNNI